MTVKAYRRNRWQPRAGKKLAEGVPFPALADGCMVASDMRVVHVDSGALGRLLWVRWCTPEGRDMGNAARATPKGKLKPGGWWATVAWYDEPPAAPVAPAGRDAPPGGARLPRGAGGRSRSSRPGHTRCHARCPGTCHA